MRDCRLKKYLVSSYNNIYTIVNDIRKWYNLHIKYKLNIMSSEKTLEYILKNKCSISRYGDGEITYILHEEFNITFQEYSPELSKRLIETLSKNSSCNLLICIPRYLNTLRGCTPKCKTFWTTWRKSRGLTVSTMLNKHCGKGYVYGDALITRPYIDCLDRTKSEKIFNGLKKIWNNRDVLIIEGSQSRLGVGNDLFANTKSIKRILAPAVNAFEYYEEIKQELLLHYSGELVLIALGPTATVLAADLSVYGIQTLDIGHVDIEYEWFLRNAVEKIVIDGKFTNENTKGRVFSKCDDYIYNSQIIKSIGCED